MIYQNIKTVINFFVGAILIIGCEVKTMLAQSQKITVHIILGSTRQDRLSDKIAQELKKTIDYRTDIVAEIIDLRDFNLPFLNDSVAPASRKKIIDPVIQKWSDTIARGNAFVIVVPEYNAGYPGVLKNALDTLYIEWNNKPIAFVSYSGGPNGGTSATAQLRMVTQALKMRPVATEINIPQSRKALDEKGLIDKNLASRFNIMFDEIIGALNK
jgi:NAD(P)H-dependent FMN reductase